MRTLPKIASVFAAALLTLLFTGCVWIGDALKALTPEGSEDPLLSDTATEAAATEDAGSGQNPVFTLLSDFFGTFEKACSGLYDEALHSGADGAELYSALMSDAAVAARIRSTVGMLSEGDERGSYSGTFTGAYAGNGVLDIRNAFEYRFDSGEELTGTLSGGKELHAVFSGGSEYSDFTLVKTSDGFRMTVMHGGQAGVLVLSPASLEYARVPNAEVGDEPGIPDGAKKLVFTEGSFSIAE